MAASAQPDALALVEALTEEDVVRALDELRRREKSLRGLLASIRRRRRADIKARRLPAIQETSHA
jgi:hypothetical protein